MFPIRGLPLCRSKRIEELRHSVSSPGFNITGLNRKRLESLYDDGYVTTLDDILTLPDRVDVSELIPLKGWDRRSVEGLYRSIEASLSIPLNRFIYALGIPNVGLALSDRMAQDYHTIDAWLTAIDAAHTSPSTSGVFGGELLAFFADREQRRMVTRLMDLLDIQDSTRYQQSLSLTGKLIVFTGSFKTMHRQEAIRQIQALGGIVSNVVRPKVDYLIVGDSPGTRKLEKAKRLGITILGEKNG